VRLKGVTRYAAVGCWLAAAIALLTLSFTGNPRAGAAVALGLAIGSLNGMFAQRAFDAGLNMRWASLPRLALLSGIALGAGLLIGADYAWLVLLGVGAAQMVLVGFAARSVLSR
jgi:hypothetical protein